MAKISIRSVTKLYGRKEAIALSLKRQGADKQEILRRTGCNLALDGVTLDIAEGEVFVLMGLSGSGKSTLIRHVNRLIDPSSGCVLVDGEDIMAYGPQALRQFRQHAVSMVFQGFGLMPHRTVLQNAAFGLLSRGVRRKDAYLTAAHWIGLVSLQGYENSYPSQLSGGMRQRVGLARALAVDTGIILMDEAFGALDPLTRAEMQDLLLDLQARLRKTIIFVTHDLDEAFRVGNRVAVMKDGAVVQIGTPAEILARPEDDYVLRFVERWKRR